MFGIAIVGLAYLLIVAGMWKNDIKKVYGRRSRREKILTVGVIAVSFLMMLIVCGQNTKDLVSKSIASNEVNRLALWIFNDNTGIVLFAVFFIVALPTMIFSISAIDEIAQKQIKLALPYYLYLVLFLIEPMFYEIGKVSIFGWVMLMLLSSMFYEGVRMKHEGKERKTLAILVLQILLFLCMAVASYRETLWIVLTYAIYVVGNLLVIFVINRASILKKKYWLCTIVIIYCLVFAIGR